MAFWTVIQGNITTLYNTGVFGSICSRNFPWATSSHTHKKTGKSIIDLESVPCSIGLPTISYNLTHFCSSTCCHITHEFYLSSCMSVSSKSAGDFAFLLPMSLSFQNSLLYLLPSYNYIGFIKSEWHIFTPCKEIFHISSMGPA